MFRRKPRGCFPLVNDRVSGMQVLMIAIVVMILVLMTMVAVVRMTTMIIITKTVLRTLI